MSALIPTPPEVRGEDFPQVGSIPSGRTVSEPHSVSLWRQMRLAFHEPDAPADAMLADSLLALRSIDPTTLLA